MACPLTIDEPFVVTAEISGLLSTANGELRRVTETHVDRRRDPSATDRILRSLPAWFGIERSIRDYVASAAIEDSFLATQDGRTIGVALAKQHFPETAELTLLAVHADVRRSGAGTALVEAVAEAARAAGASQLAVHTVGPSFESEPYAETRAFYRRVGFLPLQELHGIDWDGPTLIFVRHL
ncbi:acetyltransferase (GNAT) family protein [Promicromonospora sp. AC04]|nr:acetyltransferase (GNAT) family protein [Promicromonospora sp. AC04]